MNPDENNNHAHKRRRGNSAPPFVRYLPLRPHNPEWNVLRLPRIDELDYQDRLSDDETEDFPEPETPCPRKGRDETETENDDIEETENENCKCEFSTPCRMDPSPDGMHYRKVVSHVFGRNKASTKLFPDHVWVHYCRKHYQRARYRAGQWPFTQCDLLIESLHRMEEWGGVESFELTLRRREVLRVEEEEVVNKTTQTSRTDRVKGDKRVRNKSNANRVLASGRKHPTAIVAPVPRWMHACLGKGKTFDEIRAVIKAIHGHMSEQKPSQNVTSLPTPLPSKGKQTTAAQKQSVGSTVRFPDIEILPTFQPWVHEEAQKRREAQGQGSGTTRSSRPAPTTPVTTATPSQGAPSSSSRSSRSWRQMVGNVTSGKWKKGPEKRGRKEN